jgi:hypothetical protein
MKNFEAVTKSVSKKSKFQKLSLPPLSEGLEMPIQRHLNCS